MSFTDNTAEVLGYALAKQVPDMMRGFSIETNYGALHLYDDDAKKVAILVRKLLERKLRKAKIT